MFWKAEKKQNCLINDCITLVFDFFFYKNKNNIIFNNYRLFLLQKTKITLPYQWLCNLSVRFYEKQKKGSITAFILEQRKNDQNHLLNNWIVIMAKDVYEFMTAVRGYHYYKTLKSCLQSDTLLFTWSWKPCSSVQY